MTQPFSSALYFTLHPTRIDFCTSIFDFPYRAHALAILYHSIELRILSIKEVRWGYCGCGGWIQGIRSFERDI